MDAIRNKPREERSRARLAAHEPGDRLSDLSRRLELDHADSVDGRELCRRRHGLAVDHEVVAVGALERRLDHTLKLLQVREDVIADTLATCVEALLRLRLGDAQPADLLAVLALLVVFAAEAVLRGCFEMALLNGDVVKPRLLSAS